METIAARRVDTGLAGRSYGAEQRPLLPDLQSLARAHVLAGQRFRLSAVKGRSGRDWRCPL
jgi:hypothetical protein